MQQGMREVGRLPTVFIFSSPISLFRRVREDVITPSQLQLLGREVAPYNSRGEGLFPGDSPGGCVHVQGREGKGEDCGSSYC